MKLSELLASLDEAKWSAPNVEVTGVAYDSRTVKPGDVFVCIKGLNHDGHDFAPEAAKRGAVAIVAERTVESGEAPVVIVKDSRLALAVMTERFFNDPSSRLRLIGVTGTKGKTTTTFLIRAVLQSSDYKTGLIGTVINIVGDAVLPVIHTTPEATDLSGAMAQMADSKCKYAVMEVSSHAIVLKRVAGCRFRGAVFTNLTQDHLDFHKDMEDYFQAKASFVRGTAIAGGPDYVAVNIDDSYGRRIAEELGDRAITYGMSQTAMVRASGVLVGRRGSEFKLGLPGGRQEKVKMRLIGRFNVYNALAATAVGYREGIDVGNIVRALEEFGGVPGRFESVNEGQEFTVVVDYAHSPASLENVLLTARELGPERIITVFGCGGDRDKTKRPVMGKVASRLSDYTIVTSDNPRSEEPEEIIKQILPGIQSGTEYEVIPDRASAIFRAIALARPGDFVLIAGKGHETYQILKDRTIHFDDREVAREALRSLK